MPEYLVWWLRLPATFYQSTFLTAVHMTHDERWEESNGWMKSWLHIRLHMSHSEPFAKEIHFRHTRDHLYPALASEAPLISHEEIRALSLRPDVVVILFDLETDSLVKLGADFPKG